MEGSSSNTNSNSPPRSNGAPLPPAGPRRPAAAVRMPSCQIQRNWDRGEASGGAISSSSASQSAAAARRRSATVALASPLREYPPASSPHLYPATAVTTRSQNEANNHDENDNNSNNFLRVPGSGVPEDSRISIATQDPPVHDSHNPDDKNIGWGAALMTRGRRRAATTVSALGRTLTGGGGGGASGRESRADGAAVDIGDIEATRRARAASHVSKDDIPQSSRNDAYDSQVHDMLDVIDPEVQTVNLLGDIQNAFFIPPNRLFDRTRKLQLTKPPESKESIEERQQQLKDLYTPPRTEEQKAAAAARKAEKEEQQQQQAQTGTTATRPDELPTTGLPPIITTGQDYEKRPQVPEGTEGFEGEEGGEGTNKPLPGPPPPLKPSAELQAGEVQGPATPVDTEESVLADQKYVKGRYFVLPAKLVDMSDWSDQEKADLDDYVRHLMHNKKEIFRRRMRGFGKYVRTPLGCFVTVYASLLTFWGAAWVLFLIGWLPAGDRQAYFVEICDQILVALFCITGLGLIPWRIRDTYHAFYIIKYHRKTLRLRKKRGLPKLADDNDLPNDQVYNHDLEMNGHAQDAVLTDEEQALLVKHQTALSKSHTYYRPHETFTHHAFPLSFLIAIIVLCDCHSCFQLALGSATWSISYHHWYKKILTTIVLCFSLSCNITGGICIGIGSRLSRKKEVVEALLRSAITEEALKRKQDAEKYRAEKRQRLEKEAYEKKHGRQDSNGGGLVKAGSYPINAVKNAPQRLKLIARRNSSDPGLSEKLVSNTRRSSSSARSSLDSRRSDQQQASMPLKRAASERLVSSSDRKDQ